MADETTQRSAQAHPVVRLGGEGDGVVETADGARYVPGVLPGESVAFDDAGSALRIGAPSPDRRTDPLCPHAGRCGGCALPHMSDTLYRQWKATLVPDVLARHGIVTDVRPMISAPPASRRRAVLSVKREPHRILVGFHRARSHEIEPLEACAVLTPRIVAGLDAVRTLAIQLLPMSGETHVTVIDTTTGLDVTFTPLPAKAAKLQPAARAEIVRLADAHRLARVSLGTDVLVMRQTPILNIGGIEVIPPPGAFLQAVADAERAMADLVVAGVGKSKVVADLFAGLGTFTFALARTARVLAVDSDRRLIDALAAAARNAQGLKPIETKVRDLFTDPLSPRELAGVDAVVFDPPRAGARDQARALAGAQVPRVVAVSCNPATLVRDLETLIQGGYTVDHVTPVDQFLYSPHIEVVAVLSRPRTARRK